MNFSKFDGPDSCSIVTKVRQICFETEMSISWPRYNLLPVSEGGDDQTVGTAQELVHVGEVYICDGNQTLVRVLLEVEAGLLQPLKVIGRPNVHLHLRKDGQNS